MNQELPCKKRVLIVDDEPRIGKILCLKLRLGGFECISVTTGSEALAVAQKQSPDLMLLDIVMPGMDGFQVLEKLRAFSRLPVIAFSAKSENGPRALELGADAFLAKPFDVDDLVRRTQRMLDDQW
jgi:two-component system KDP operon response regulator KdpE